MDRVRHDRRRGRPRPSCSWSSWSSMLSSEAGEAELDGLAAELEATEGSWPSRARSSSTRSSSSPRADERPNPAAWARARTPTDWLAIAAALAVFGYLGWDSALWDARLQLAAAPHRHRRHRRARPCIALRGGELPRTPIDLPLLGLLAALRAGDRVARSTSGMSLRAMAAIVAFAAMLPVALLAVRHRPAWVGLVTSVPVLLLSIPTLVTCSRAASSGSWRGARASPRCAWRPRARRSDRSRCRRSCIIPAWALAGLIEPAGLRRVVRTGLVVVGVPLTILSGSRSAWLAIAAAARDRGSRRGRGGSASGCGPSRAATPRRRCRGIGALAVVGVAARARRCRALDRRDLAALPRARSGATPWRRGQRSAPRHRARDSCPTRARRPRPTSRFPVRQPHSHNLPLGVLGDAGLVGLVAGLRRWW